MPLKIQINLTKQKKLVCRKHLAQPASFSLYHKLGKMKQGANVLLVISSFSSSSSSTGQAFFLELECTEDAAGTLRELQVWWHNNNNM